MIVEYEQVLKKVFKFGGKYEHSTQLPKEKAAVALFRSISFEI